MTITYLSLLIILLKLSGLIIKWFYKRILCWKHTLERYMRTSNCKLIHFITRSFFFYRTSKHIHNHLNMSLLYIYNKLYIIKNARILIKLLNIEYNSTTNMLLYWNMSIIWFGPIKRLHIINTKPDRHFFE